MRILLQTVGTGRDPNPGKDDPGNPVWEAMAFVVRHIQPDVLVQLCSQKTLNMTLPKFESQCRDQGIQLPAEPQHWKRHCPDPDDVVGLALDYAKILDQLQEEYPGAVVHIDYTSGTKAMSAAAVSAGIARDVQHLCYAVGPRDAGGRAMETDKIVALPTSQLLADRRLLEFGRLFNEGDYHAVVVEARKLASNFAGTDQGQRAQVLADVAEAYRLWDSFQWSATHEALKKLDFDQAQKHGWDVEILKDQIQFARWANKKGKRKRGDPHMSAERLVDLFANILRRIERKSYDDAVARLYRLIEAILQARFAMAMEREQSDNPTGGVPRESLRDRAPCFHGKACQRWPDRPKWNLGLQDTIDVLAELGDDVGRFTKARYGRRGDPNTLSNRLQRRNDSYLAHGTTPADKAVAEGLACDAQAMLTKHLDSIDGDPSLDKALTMARFVTCPWVT